MGFENNEKFSTVDNMQEVEKQKSREEFLNKETEWREKYIKEAEDYLQALKNGEIDIDEDRVINNVIRRASSAELSKHESARSSDEENTVKNDLYNLDVRQAEFGLENKKNRREEEKGRIGEKIDLLKEFTDVGRSKLLEDNIKKIEECKKRLESPEAMIDRVASIVKMKMDEYEDENRILSAIKEGKL